MIIIISTNNNMCLRHPRLELARRGRGRGGLRATRRGPAARGAAAPHGDDPDEAVRAAAARAGRT